MIEEEIQFRDYEVPGLQAGTYRIEVTQELKDASGSTGDRETFQAHQTVSAEGTRFALETGDIHKMFPPPNFTGEYEKVLPQIVFTRPMLPWERAIEIPDNQKPSEDEKVEFPWLALAVFLEDQLDGEGASPDTKTRTMTVRQLTGDDSVVSPDLEGITNPEEICQTIKFSTDTFRKIMPYFKEIRFLAHVRSGSTEYKAVLNQPEDGMFSVVASNRFARWREGDPSGTKNIVHLVSLEGFEDCINHDADGRLAGKSHVRMVSLASWSFVCLRDPLESFEVLLDSMAGEPEEKDKLLLRLPVPDLDPQADEQQRLIVERVLEGYVPMEYRTASGEETYAWYRGPCVPVICPPMERIDPNCPPSGGTPCELTRSEKLGVTLTTAAAAMIYDKENGLFDLSYAAAWQLGQSLAYSSPDFGRQLLQIRRKGHRSVNQMQSFLQSGFYGVDVDVKNPRRYEGYVEEEGTPDQISKNWIQSRLAKTLDSKATGAINAVFSGIRPLSSVETPIEPAVAQTVDDGDESNPVDDLRYLYGNERYTKAILRDLGEELQPISDWLGQLMVLQRVPLDYLVPDWRMLPVGCMRYFYIDPNWLECMMDGALSIGVQSSRDLELNAVIKQEVSDRAKMAAYQVRQGLRKKEPRHVAPVMPGDWCGVLIRSSLISGYPGMEVMAFKDTAPLSVLRIDPVMPDLMLCLFDGVPTRVDFLEPKEGTYLGVNEREKDGQIVRTIKLRFAKGTDIGQDIKSDTGVFEVGPELFRNAEEGVLNMTALQEGIRQRLDALDATDQWGPAEFTLQMFRQTMRFSFFVDPRMCPREGED